MIKNIKEHIEYPEQGILSKEIVKDKITLFCMAKGTEISEHTTTKQAAVYVIEGKGIFNLNGKDIQMLPNKLIFMKEDAPHSLKAQENTSFLLTLFKN